MVLKILHASALVDVKTSDVCDLSSKVFECRNKKKPVKTREKPLSLSAFAGGFFLKLEGAVRKQVIAFSFVLNGSGRSITKSLNLKS
jgi:hypothetical protein